MSCYHFSVFSGISASTAEFLSLSLLCFRLPVILHTYCFQVFKFFIKISHFTKVCGFGRVLYLFSLSSDGQLVRSAATPFLELHENFLSVPCPEWRQTRLLQSTAIRMYLVVEFIIASVGRRGEDKK